MSDGIIRPEQNIPPRENYKDKENVNLPSEVSKKRKRKISDFGDQSRKQLENIDLNNDAEKKEDLVIEEVAERNTKQGQPVNENQKREIKEEKTIPESLTQKKDEEEIPDNRQHPIKEEEIIPEQVTGNKEEVEIPDERQHPIKEGEEYKEQDHEFKSEQQAYEERIHPQKEEPEVEDQDHLAKEEPEVEDQDHLAKTEEEPLIEEDHPVKEELAYGEYDHEEKIESEIDDADHEAKTEEEVLNTLEHEVKGESEIPDKDHESKTEIGFTKNGRNWDINQHKSVQKAETDGYVYGQPDINTNEDTNYEDEMDQIDDSQRLEKTENGPAPNQVSTNRPGFQETENVHYDDVEGEIESLKINDQYRFTQQESTNTDNPDLSLEYSLRKEKTNVKDIYDYNLVESEQEPIKTYRTIGSMSDSEKRQYQSLFTYDVKGSDNRFPNDPKGTKAPFNSASPTNTENTEYSEGDSQIDGERQNKLSDGFSQPGDYIDSETSQQYESVNSILEDLGPQSTKSYSYEEVMTTFLNELKTDRPIQQPSQPTGSSDDITNLDSSIVGREDSVNNGSLTNQVELRPNPKIADDLQDVSGIDNTQNKVSADSHETDPSYGQVGRGDFRAETLPDGSKTAADQTSIISEEGTDYQAIYKSPIYVDGGDIVVNHQVSPKIGDMTLDGQAETAASASLPASEDTSSSPFINDTSIIKPTDQVDRLSNETTTTDNVLANALNENTVHQYSPKVGQRDGDTAEASGIEFRAQDIFAGPAAQLSMAVDFIQADARGIGERINVPYDIQGVNTPTNNTNTISYGTVQPKIDVRMPLFSLLTDNQVAQSIISPIIDGLLEPLASTVAAQTGRYRDATINDTFANIATREILTDGMRFAYSRMHNAVLYGPSSLGTSMEDGLEDELDTSTPSGALAKSVTAGVNNLLRIPQPVGREDTLRRGFIPATMNKYFNKSAGTVYDNMTSYLNALRNTLSGGGLIGLSSLTGEPSRKQIDSIDVGEQKDIAEGMTWTEELRAVNTTMVEMLSPMEYKKGNDLAQRYEAGYNIEEDRRGSISGGSSTTWRQSNRTQKPTAASDTEDGSWLSTQAFSQYQQLRQQAYEEAGFANAAEMAEEDFTMKYLFFSEGSAIESGIATESQISEIENERTQSLYTTVSAPVSSGMNNVYRTAGLRREVPSTGQQNYSQITVKEGTDFDSYAIEIENAQIITGMKDDFYHAMKEEVGDYYSFGRMLQDQDDSTNLMHLKDHIAAESQDIDLEKASAIVYPSSSYGTYIESLKSTNRNTIQYLDSDGNPTETPPDDSYLAEVYSAVYNTEQGKDLFAGATQYLTFAQNVRGDSDQSLINNLKQQTYFEDDDTTEDKTTKNSINAVRLETGDNRYKAIREGEGKTGYLEYLNETEPGETYTTTSQAIVENSTHIIRNLQTQIDQEGNLDSIITLNEGSVTSRPTVSEENQSLISGYDNAKLSADPESESNILSVLGTETNDNSSETVIQGQSLANVNVATEINIANLDQSTVVVNGQTGIGTDATPQELKTQNVKSNIALSFRYSNHTFSGTTGEVSYSGEERILNNGDEEREGKQSLITDINNNKRNYWTDRGGIGYIVAMTKYDNTVSDTTSSSFLYRIPFQFNPEIAGESRTANWSSQQAFGRTNDILLWSNTSSRTIQFKTTLAILYGEDHNAGREGVVTDVNQIYSWGQYWTKDNVIDVLNKYRMLVLPIDETPENESEFSGKTISPPIIAIVRGDADKSWSKDYPNDPDWYARWIVTDISIDPREEAGYTLDRTPRVYDVSMSLKEVFNSVRTYQYIRGMKDALGIANI